jgi:hypothetical protein
MKLTHPDAWHTFAGGTFAAPDKHSYQAITTIGNYCIDPVSLKSNSNHHIGYAVRFENVLGQLSGGLHVRFAGESLVNLTKARKLCDEHCRSNNGTLTAKQN